MAINLNHGYTELREHIGHEIVCVPYGHVSHGEFPDVWAVPANVAIECETCSEVLLDFDRPEEDQHEQD